MSSALGPCLRVCRVENFPPTAGILGGSPDRLAGEEQRTVPGSHACGRLGQPPSRLMDRRRRRVPQYPASAVFSARERVPWMRTRTRQSADTVNRSSHYNSLPRFVHSIADGTNMHQVHLDLSDSAKDAKAKRCVHRGGIGVDSLLALLNFVFHLF